MAKRVENLPVVSGTNIPLDNFVPVQPLVYQSFMVNKHDDGSVSYCSDVSVLMQQKSLERRLGIQTVRDILSSLGTGSNPMSDFLKKVSDEDLLKFIKPRYLQTPSELKIWFNSLKEESDYNKYISELKKQFDDEDNNNDDKSTSSSGSSSGSSE